MPVVRRAAEAAATFYVGLMPGSRIDNVMHAPADYPAGKRGDVLLVEFTLAGRPFQALNGGRRHEVYRGCLDVDYRRRPG